MVPANQSTENAAENKILDSSGVSVHEDVGATIKPASSYTPLHASLFILAFSLLGSGMYLFLDNSAAASISLWPRQIFDLVSKANNDTTTHAAPGNILIADNQVLGITTQGGSAVTLSKVLDTDFNLSVAGYVSGTSLTATTSTGAPLSISSTQKVTNLNVDLVDGYDWTGNMTFSGSPTFSSNVSYSNNSTISGNVTFSGSPTFSGNPVFSGSTTLGNVSVTGDLQITGGGKQVKLPPSTSDPTTLGAGSMYYNTSSNLIKYYNGSSWVDLTTGVSGSNYWTDAGTYLYPNSGESLGNTISGGSNKIGGMYMGSSSPLYMGAANDTNFTFASSALGLYVGNNSFNINSNVFVANGQSGNIGMGISSPGAHVHIENPYAFDSFRVDDATGDTTPFTIDQNGNVGIGTTTPGTSLDVTVPIAYVGTILNIRAAGGTAIADISNAAAGGGYGILNLYASGGNTRIRPDSLSYFSGPNTVVGVGYTTYGTPEPWLGLVVSGNVGIGTNAPGFKLDVAGNIGPNANDTYNLGSDTLRWADLYLGPGTMRIGSNTTDDYAIGYDTTSNYLGFNYQNSGNAEMVIDANGNVGIGTTSPVTKVQVDNASGNLTMLFRNSSSAATDVTTFDLGRAVDTQRNAIIYDVGGGSVEWTVGTLYNAGASNTKYSIGTGFDLTSSIVTVDSSGLVGIGNPSPAVRLDVQGTVQANYVSSGTAALCHATNGAANDENINDCSGAPADLAEMYATLGDLEPGDVVVPDPSGKNLLIKSNSKYQKAVVGVISTNPTDIMANETITFDRHPQPLSLQGRVPVKVSLENGPIAVGDPLTTSSAPGVAMKATRAGVIIGRALEDYDGTKRVSDETKFQEDHRVLDHIDLAVYVSDPSKWNSNVGKIAMLTSISWIDPNSEDPDVAGITTTSASLFSALIDKKQTLPPEPLSTLVLPLEASGSGTYMPIDSPVALNSDLTVLGQTTLGATSIAGTLLVDAAVEISRIGISTVGDTLFIQKNKLANVNVLDGLLLLTKDGSIQINGNVAIVGNVNIEGNLHTTGVLGAQKLNLSSSESTASAFAPSVGKGTIPLGKSEISISTEAITDRSLVFVTGTSPETKSIYVKSITNGSFIVSIDQITNTDATFNWWVID